MSILSAPIPATALSAPVETNSDAPGVANLKLSEVWAEKGEMSFSDLLDIVNPLQHIPIVSTIYRAITGDKIGLAARLLGGGLFGGPIGLASTGISMAFEQASGNTIDGHLLAMFDGVTGGDSAADPVRVATAAATTPQQMPDKAPPSGPAIMPPPALATPRAAGVQPFTPGQIARRTPHPIPVPSATRDAPAPPASAPRPGAAHAAAAGDAKAAAERYRIAQVIREAEKAQAELLVASLGSGINVPVSGFGNTAGALPASAQDGFARHPNRIPPGATPQWIGLAIERALNKYQQNGKPVASRTATVAAAAPTARR